jgi:hypothetical protein
VSSNCVADLHLIEADDKSESDLPGKSASPELHVEDVRVPAEGGVPECL